ncbi:MAG: cell division protein FtsB, partial [Sulfuriferula sp.]
MRILTGILLGLLLLVQYPLWLGKGSWLQVWHTQAQLVQQEQVNAKLTARNAAMYAEVRDLKQGLGAIEERARNELGMVRKNEVFFQILDAPPPSPVATN